MGPLIELVQIVTKHLPPNTDRLHMIPGEHHRYHRLIQAFREGKVSTDKEAAHHLQLKESCEQYRTLKSRMSQILYHNVLLINLDKEKYSRKTRLVFWCYRNLSAMQVLFLLGAYKSAGHIARKTFLKAQEYEITDVALRCAKTLRTLACYSAKPDDYDKYHAFYDHFKKTQDAEDRSLELYERIIIHYVASGGIKPDFLVEALKYAEEADGLRKQSDSYQTNINYFRILTTSYAIASAHEKALEAWIEFEKYLQGHQHHDYKTRMGEAAINRMVCYMHLRRYEEGKQCALSGMAYLTAGQRNWVVLMEHYFLLCMQSARYEEAKQVLDDVTTSPGFSLMPMANDEKWRIFREYNRFALAYTGSAEARTYRFNKNKFYSDTPIFSKDKVGFNVAILALQIVFHLQQGNYRPIIDRIEAIKRYIQRHLKQEHLQRSVLFFKMVAAMENADFNYEKTVQRTRANYTLLQQTTRENKGNMDGMEIIPFDTLWEMALIILQRPEREKAVESYYFNAAE